MMDKVYPSATAALDGLCRDGLTVLLGGFGLCGIPEALIEALRESGARDLVVASGTAGTEDFGLGRLLERRQVARVLSSYVGENPLFERQFLSGELEVELVPQGTLAERMRAAGAGIPAFFTRTGAGTLVAEGKDVREFDGADHVMERALPGDLALVKAWRADPLGNLVYRKTARNFNPMAATAGRVCVAEVDELVPVGALDPDHVHTPGVYVHRIVVNPTPEKRVERRTVRA